MIDAERLTGQARFIEVLTRHNAGERDKAVHNGRRNAKLLTQLMVHMAADGHVFSDITILDAERACTKSSSPLLSKGDLHAVTHVLRAKNARTLEEDILLEGLDADAESVSQSGLLLIEAPLNLRNGRAECVAVNGVIILVIAIDNAPVLHGAGTQNSAGKVLINRIPAIITHVDHIDENCTMGTSAERIFSGA